MADIVARLKLDNKDYEQKLEKAKNSTRKFAQDGGAGVSSMVSAFGKLASAVAACKVAQDAFNAVMKSSQAYSDTFANAMSSVRGVVDNVVYSLANADFTSFERGLRKVAEASWAASAALDQLWNTKVSASYFTSKNMADLTELLGKMRDETVSSSQKQVYQKMIDDIIKDQRGVVATTVATANDAIFALINKSAGGKLNPADFSFNWFEEALRMDVAPNRDALKAQLSADYAEYKKLSGEIFDKNKKWETEANKYGQITSQKLVLNDNGKELQAALDKQYASVIAKYTLLNIMSDEQLQQVVSEANYAQDMTRQMERMAGRAVQTNNLIVKTTKAEEKATLTGEQYAQSFHADYWYALSRGIKQVHDDVEIIDLTLETEAIPSMDEYNQALQALQATHVTAAQGIGAIGSILSDVSGLLDDQSAAWLNYTANIVNSISAAIPALEALATAQAAAAATGAALNPWTAVAAVAAVTSIGVALASIPKFATGGVVPGNQLSGDNVLIRANSGEVVLTKAQANNIGEALRGGMGGRVVFEIRGDKLVGVLNAQNRLTAQNYGVR